MAERGMEISEGAQRDEAPALRSRRLRSRIGVPVVLAVLIVAGAVWASGRGNKLPENRLIPSSSTLQSLLAGIPQHGFVLGRASAPVTVTEFADLQCPYCDEFALTAFPKLVSSYVRPGKVKFVFQNLPILGVDSLRAAAAAVAAARQNKLWEFVEAFYSFQRPENSGYVKAPFLSMVASTVRGLRVDRLIAGSQSAGVRAAMIAELRRNLRRGLHSTPTFIIAAAGRKSMHLVGYHSLTPQLDQALTG